MGVPQFFHWLVTHYPKELLSDRFPHDGKRPDILYLDFNCGIHPAVKKKDYDTLEEMYEAVCNYLDTILAEVNPTRQVYIAIDGVAPMGKMKQQRYRRFKAVKDRAELDAIDRKHQRYTPAKWDFNMISPGTEFMDGLTIRLEQHIATTLKDKFPTIQITLDPASNPGEGEHKIMHHIRTATNPDDIVSVYGLDSDLIFLCLLHYRPYFCLFREKIHFDRSYVPPENETPFTYLNLTNFRKIILAVMDPQMTKSRLEDWGILKPFHERLSDFRSSQAMLDIDVSIFNVRPGETPPPAPIKTTQAIEEDMRQQDLEILSEPITNLDDRQQQELIVDYVGICMLLGNDFLPHIPSLKIKDGALTRLINCYKITQARLPKSHLVKLPSNRTKNIKSQINDAFLVQLLSTLSDYEEGDLKLQSEASQVRRRKFKFRLSQTSDPYERDITRLEYIEDQWRDTLQLGFPGWKPRYYHQYIHSTTTKAIEKMVRNYLTGVLWNIRYYLGNCATDITDMISTCPDWLWKYNYLVAPSISDINKFMQEHRKFFTDEIELTQRPPVRPDVQLLMILPPQSSSLLKPELQTLMTSADSPISFQYPIDFQIDLFGHRYRWECYPILPPTSLKLTRTAVEVLLDTRWSDFPIRLEESQIKNKSNTKKQIKIKVKSSNAVEKEPKNKPTIKLKFKK